VNIDKGVPEELHGFLWKKRLVLVFDASAETEPYKKQIADLESRMDEVEERDIVLITVVEGTLCCIDGRELGGEEAERVREYFGVKPGAFSVLVIGKDGTEKLQADRPVPAEDIFSLIDSMPMRRREAERKRREAERMKTE
jgi:hypothetical protein